MIASDLTTTLESVAPGQVYPAPAPENATLNFITYQLVAGVPISHLSGQSGLTNSRYQVDCFSATRLGADTLAQNVKSAMDAATLFKSVCALQQDFFEEDTRYYRVSLDFSLWH